jgi:hypothetical protein
MKRSFALGVVVMSLSAVCFGQITSVKSFEMTTGNVTSLSSSVDIKGSNLAFSVAGGNHIFDVGVPGVNISSGVYLLRVVYGNPATGSVSRVAIAIFGTDAKYSGTLPMTGTIARLEGIEDGQNPVFLQNSFTATGLRLEVTQTLLTANESVLLVDLYGADSAPITVEPSDPVDWFHLPHSILFKSLSAGSLILPPIPGGLDKPSREEATPYAFGAKLESTKDLRILRPIGSPSWGPPAGAWQPYKPGNGSIPTDFDNDGRPDYQLPGGDIVPGGGGIHYGTINLDNTWLTSAAWIDRDGDGMIDRNEVIAVTGQCVFPGANNSFGIFKDSKNQRHIVQINTNTGYTDDNGVFHPTYNLNPPGVLFLKGGSITYDYNADTGELVVVFQLDPNEPGYVAYRGPATGYPYWKGF